MTVNLTDQLPLSSVRSCSATISKQGHGERGVNKTIARRQKSLHSHLSASNGRIKILDVSIGKRRSNDDFVCIAILRTQIF